jgi:hypothetical protein
MKKLIQIILVVVATLIFNYMSAQNILEKVEPSTICPGQCTSVWFRFNPKCKLPNQQTNAYPPQPMIFSYGGSVITQSYSVFYTNPKQISKIGQGLQYDTLYSIPICFGTTTITLPSAVQYTIKATGYCSTAYLGGDETLTLTIVDCSVLGIEEQELNNQPIIYYDLYGNRIEPRLNEVMIKQQGRRRTKIIIQ